MNLEGRAMNSKISLFNKSIVKSDCKRFWWISALEFLFALLCIFAMISGAEYSNAEIAPKLYDGFMINYMMPVLVLQFILPVALTVLLMSYLNKGNAVSFMHSLPLGRTRLFGSHILSALMLLLSPILLTCLSLSATLAIPDIAERVCLSHIWLFGLHSAIYSLFVCCATTVVCTLSGSMIFSFILTYIIAALPAVAEMMARYIITHTLYGYPDVNCNVKLFLWLYKAPGDATPLYFAGLVIAAAVFLLIANAILKKRALENYGEIVAFPKLKPIFVYCVAVCAGALGYLYFSLIIEHYNLLYLIPFGILGIIIANMLNKKQLTLKGAPRAIIVYTACIVLLFGFFKLDISGYERRIPQADSVSSAQVYLNSYPDRNVRSYEIDGVKYVFKEKDAFIPEISGNDIEKLLTVHRYVVEHRNGSGIENSLLIKYKLKNGKTVDRRYSIKFDTGAAAEAVKPLAELNVVKAQKLPLLDGTHKDFTVMQCYDSRIGTACQTTDAAQMQMLSDALIKDLSALSFEDYLLEPEESAMTLRVEYTKEAICSKPLPKDFNKDFNLDSDDTFRSTENYIIRPSYKNTLAALEELGLIPELPPAENVEKISAEYVGVLYEDIPYVESSEIYSYKDGDMLSDSKAPQTDPTALVITDPEQVREFYNFICENPIVGRLYTSSERCKIMIYYKNQGVVAVMYDLTRLPENIQSQIQK